MRRWIIRSLWLAAWSFWIWLGFGLYRELPRDLGPVVCRLAMDAEESERPIGFMGEGREFVSVRESEERIAKFRIWDVATGRLKRVVNGPNAHDYWGDEFDVVDGLLISVQGRRPDLREDDERDYDRASILDLRNGRWTDLSVSCNERTRFHGTKPWCLLEARGDIPEEVAVFDLEKRKVVFQWRKEEAGPRPEDDGMSSFFIGDHKIALAFTSPRADRRSDEPITDVLEIRSIVGDERPRRIEGLEIGLPIAAAGNRLAWPGAGTGLNDSVEVFDLDVGAIILPRKVQEQTGKCRRRHGTPRFSQDGRFVLIQEGQYAPSVLREVDTGKVIWSSWPHEMSWGFVSDRFYVMEDWSKLVFVKTELVTFAERSLTDGRVQLRTWESCIADTRDASAGGRFAYVNNVHGDDPHEIRALPFRVNYPLLALCQAILALPLVLLWAVLRWRRKRRTRSSVQP